MRVQIPPKPMINKEVVNLIGLSVAFSGMNKMTLEQEWALYKYHRKIRDVLERNNRTTVLGMYIEEAIQMYMDNGWREVEVIEHDVPAPLTSADYIPNRMRLWVKNNRVVRAIAG